MTADSLSPKQLGVLWQCNGRRVRQLLGELEALGFRLTQDKYGARLCPLILAQAVSAAREARQPLSSLRDRPELQGYLEREEIGPVTLLIEARTELAILREVVIALHQALQTRATPTSFREPDWKGLGLPNPRYQL